MSIQIVVRDYNPKIDDPLIYSTWTQNSYYGMEKRPAAKRAWFKDKIQEIKKLLSEEPVHIACFKDDPITMVGYIVCTHWLYIKKDYRKEGVDTLLINRLKENHEKRD